MPIKRAENHWFTIDRRIIHDDTLASDTKWVYCCLASFAGAENGIDIEEVIKISGLDREVVLGCIKGLQALALVQDANP